MCLCIVFTQLWGIIKQGYRCKGKKRLLFYSIVKNNHDCYSNIYALTHIAKSFTFLDCHINCHKNCKAEIVRDCRKKSSSQLNGTGNKLFIIRFRITGKQVTVNSSAEVCSPRAAIEIECLSIGVFRRISYERKLPDTNKSNQQAHKENSSLPVADRRSQTSVFKGALSRRFCCSFVKTAQIFD